MAVVLSTAARADCLDDAANQYGVSTDLVHAIAEGESRMRADVVHRNANGTEDIGLMQVNSAELPTLSRYGVTRAALFDACVNAYVGTWIFSKKIARFGPTWKAVGAYNASSPDKQLLYANRIYGLLMSKTSLRVPPTDNAIEQRP
jgi:soluble lytic murein transglycosylase-like protein